MRSAYGPRDGVEYANVAQSVIRRHKRLGVVQNRVSEVFDLQLKRVPPIELNCFLASAGYDGDLWLARSLNEWIAQVNRAVRAHEMDFLMQASIKSAGDNRISALSVVQHALNTRINA
jgi:hypothetical protein